MNDFDKNIIEAINKLQDSYDAFLLYNKYTSLEDLNDNTHKKEFELLLEKFKNNDAFSYLRNKTKEE